MKKDCSKYSTLITGFIDEELDSKKMNEVQLHLEECPDCQESYAQESSVKKLVKEKVAVQQAPGYLHNRVRRKLLREGHRPRFWEIVHSLFVYRPVATSFALAVIIILVILPLYQYGPLQSDRVDRGAVAAELRGEILCLDCELSQGLGEKASHDPKTHREGIRTEDGRIWTFLNSPSQSELNSNPELLKKRVLIYGMLYQNAQYVHVQEYNVL